MKGFLFNNGFSSPLTMRLGCYGLDCQCQDPQGQYKNILHFVKLLLSSCCASFNFVSPLCGQRRGHIALLLSAQPVSVCAVNLLCCESVFHSFLSTAYNRAGGQTRWPNISPVFWSHAQCRPALFTSRLTRRCVGVACITLMSGMAMSITQCCFSVGPASKTFGQHWNNIGWMLRICC